MKRILWTLFFTVALLALGTAVVAALNLRGEDALPAESQSLSQARTATPELVARGEYLARVGNCMACHTVQGGAPYAGGRGIDTPFGVIHTSNLTPDKATGIGNWSAAEFWRALHNGRSRDGRLLYPAFPYPNYTLVAREDSDAIFAYLQSLPAVAQANRPHALRFPYNTQAALAVWRAVFFAPGAPQAEPTQTAEYNRGAYLVNGLGHCTACHTPRNALGATSDAKAFTGGLIPVQNWYAPALNAAHEAGVKEWRTDDVVALLKTGVAPKGSVTGPMAEVVFRSTQYLSDADAQAMAVYLRALPQQAPVATAGAKPSAATLERGAKVYEQHCAQCHGDQGEGKPGAFPALAGNRAVMLQDPTNLVRVVLQGGYLPATAGNPRPHGMPPFQQTLSDEDVAAVTTFVRNSWGNQAPGVGTIEVYRARERRGM
ncbi:alcohol dehydrogenase [Acidovorax carolinensis]|uniref:Alcohol dehydrogenase n=1 Tax=Acidovorax carolinensis TaxID=553814 RepID=A0A240U2K7_9BURK|nr:c-type cytochrome [Acidovorax carolinensis]ART52099.1 alcohol dehydrogenase [Acidovorax carolinensis]